MEFRDVADIPEDDRIELIGSAAVSGRKKCAFMVDGCIATGDTKKMERYIRKLLKRFPSLEVTDKMDGPIADVISIFIRVANVN